MTTAVLKMNGYRLILTLKKQYLCIVIELLSRQLIRYHIGRYDHTPPIAEILCVKNGRAIVVCGFLMKSLKTNILKV